MAKELSRSEIDALLNSLRQAQEEVVAGGAGRPSPSLPVWDQVGEEVATVLAECLTRGWRRHVPLMSVVRGDALPAGLQVDAPTRVERLGAPLSQRLWFFWDAAGTFGPAAADAFLSELEAVLPGTWTHQTLAGNQPFPEDGILLPFRGVTDGESIPLTIGIESRDLQSLRDRLGRLSAAPAPGPGGGTATTAARPAGSPTVRVGDLEVEVSVYVGGGVYPLASLASLRPGAVLPLATEVGEPAVMAIGGRVVALGEVMVTRDDTLAVRITRLLLGDEGRTAGPQWLEQARRNPSEAERTRSSAAPVTPPAHPRP